MSCLYCGGEDCGSSAGGPTMCNEHPDNKDEKDRGYEMWSDWRDER